MSRTASIKRDTSETQITLSLNLDGEGKVKLDTGLPFLEHMLTLFAKHGFFDLDLTCKGDLEIDAHHSMEDIGIVLGQAIKQAVGDKKGIRRYGFFYIPMDETLGRAVLDLSNRPALAYSVDIPRGYFIGGIDAHLFHEFFVAVVNNAGMNLHLDIIRGVDVHHQLEALFKAFARALDMATQIEPRQKGTPSTKGML